MGMRFAVSGRPSGACPAIAALLAAVLCTATVPLAATASGLRVAEPPSPGAGASRPAWHGTWQRLDRWTVIRARDGDALAADVGRSPELGLSFANLANHITKQTTALAAKPRSGEAPPQSPGELRAPAGLSPEELAALAVCGLREPVSGPSDERWRDPLLLARGGHGTEAESACAVLVSEEGVWRDRGDGSYAICVTRYGVRSSQVLRSRPDGSRELETIFCDGGIRTLIANAAPGL